MTSDWADSAWLRVIDSLLFYGAKHVHKPLPHHHTPLIQRQHHEAALKKNNLKFGSVIMNGPDWISFWCREEVVGL